jgi:hypothetical protein
LRAHLGDERALSGGAGVLARHVAPGEGVGLRGHAVLAREPVADRPFVNVRAVDLAGIKPGPAVVDESRDRVAIKPVLARPRADLLAPCVRLDVCRGRPNTPALARSGGLERLGSDARSRLTRARRRRKRERAAPAAAGLR